MTLDLAFGTAAIIGLSVLAFVVGRWLSARQQSNRGLFFTSSLALTLAFSWLLGGKLFWAELLPSASVIYWSNLMPVLLSLTAGFASMTGVLSRWNRSTTVVLLILLTSAYVAMPLARPAIAPADTNADSDWHGRVCLQSHGSTCAPAAAATLLRSASITASESQMARWCLTSQYGTEPLGLFRGLAIASQNYPRRARVASKDASTWEDLGQLPNVALVTFESFGNANGATRTLDRVFGPGREGHAVVVLGRTDGGQWLIADPAFGTTTWTDQTFQSRFTGDAIYLKRASR
ncbi:Peptidase C39 family protein [Rubripirellula amarantea]|uniref:Peptidase C39 family protein n=1 Tax=Rubripirellula amarantea TaxID=2527999 RepID=A0A5C5WTK8_9BACT|nr:peptidase C39 [Rubripirellula amarantea]TWT53888.1 Peptidase C39 family protein [Rubripirellula amarantea]